MTPSLTHLSTQSDRISALAFGIGKDPGEKSPYANIQKVKGYAHAGDEDNTGFMQWLAHNYNR